MSLWADFNFGADSVEPTLRSFHSFVPFPSSINYILASLLVSRRKVEIGRDESEQTHFFANFESQKRRLQNMIQLTSSLEEGRERVPLRSQKRQCQIRISLIGLKKAWKGNAGALACQRATSSKWNVSRMCKSWHNALSERVTSLPRMNHQWRQFYGSPFQLWNRALMSI